MNPIATEEYRALRSTIGQRGTARIWVFAVGLIAWAALTIATAALAALPVATLLPLLILGAVFEAVFALHVGVERLGRYLQVFYEQDGGDVPSLESARPSAPAPPGWERVAMAFGRPARGLGTDPLFAKIFIAATILNFVPAAMAQPVPLEAGVVGGAHLLLIARIVVARRAAGRQRATELERMRQMREERV